MHLRPGTRGDIPSLASITCGAFQDDFLFAFRFPKRHEYPLSFRAHAVFRHHFLFTRRGAHCIVCVADDDDGPNAARPLLDASGQRVAPGTVLGFSWWVRSCTKATEATDPWNQNNTSLAAAAERLLRGAEAWYEQRLCPNPASSHANVAAVKRMVAGQVEQQQSFDSSVTHWRLGGLAVDPALQGRGVGRRLVQWGIDRTREEWEAATPAMREGREVANAVMLNASPQGLILYEKMGFRRLGDHNGPFCLQFDPLSSERDWALIWDPLQLWTKPAPDTDGDEEWRPWLNGKGYLVWNTEHRREPKTVEDGGTPGQDADVEIVAVRGMPETVP